MTSELRPTTHEAFAERLRSAEARRNQELANPCRRPRATDMAAAKRRWDLEEQQEMRRIEHQHREIWE
ncbi:hypothetical protein KE336_gp11 [Aeromonas phage 4_D05]|uniref:Uncharacterized protein n=1 Tax=Aeromonas phage 4_D05 TaxID=2588099 RepID=A0A514TU94_9CAUD|nr:hypothetical protein KE336_gp11 [Aeromonas phage 4_D05]QDJ96124.1 hypothetical protein 4D05_011 [Aeromonas phage 4_D05]